MKLFTKTFGCQMNFADSDEMGRHLRERGFSPAADVDGADAVLVNTCTVRDLAEHKASSYLGKLKDWKQSHPQGLIILTGCAAERAKSEFKHRFPFIDLIVGAKDIEKFPKELDLFLQQNSVDEEDLMPSSSNVSIEDPASLKTVKDAGFPITNIGNDESNHSLVNTPVVQYVTIMRGCNYNCTYCIVPSVRGREIYRPAAEILKEVEERVADGAKEIWLLGQTVNSYKVSVIPAKAGIQVTPTASSSNVLIEDPASMTTLESRLRISGMTTNSGIPIEPSGDDGVYDFSDLLRDVNNVPGVERIRFMSPHPYYLTPNLIEAMADGEKVCEHLHLPVQSGSNSVLQRMKRNYTRESYLAGLSRLRKAVPGIAVTTDIIVGFPGETEADFKATLSLVEEADFDSAYCFKYSARPGTPSAEWPDDVPVEEKERRVNQLLEIVDGKGAEKVKQLIGTVQEVLIEDDKGNGLYRGKTRTAWRVRLKHSSLKIGDLVSVKITGTHSRELHAELLPFPDLVS